MQFNASRVDIKFEKLQTLSIFKLFVMFSLNRPGESGDLLV